ncbi:hypothetical protein L7F22_003949 [Adiantum nelumboides]|nr:hypothetical protein [Adiantum nelumboides]
MSPSEQRVFYVVLKQAAVVNRRIQEKQPLKKDIKPESMATSGPLGVLNEAYLQRKAARRYFSDRQQLPSRICCQTTRALAQDDCPGLLSRFSGNGTPGMSTSKQRVFDVVLKQAAVVNRRIQEKQPLKKDIKPESMATSDPLGVLNEAYLRCGEVCEEYAKTFYLWNFNQRNTRLISIAHATVWCRRTDVPANAPHITPSAHDRWEQIRLDDIFDGKSYDLLDAALADTVSKFPIDIQPFRDMIDGMRMDLVKARYENVDELYLYCYYVAGRVGPTSVPVMGISPDSKATTESVFNAALALGIANQLTNIQEDARRGRIYLPRDELAQFGILESDIFSSQVTDKWRAFMRIQILKRARMFFNISEQGVRELDKDSRWPVWASLTLYRQILDLIITISLSMHMLGNGKSFCHCLWHMFEVFPGNFEEKEECLFHRVDRMI